MEAINHNFCAVCGHFLHNCQCANIRLLGDAEVEWAEAVYVGPPPLLLTGGEREPHINTFDAHLGAVEHDEHEDVTDGLAWSDLT